MDIKKHIVHIEKLEKDRLLIENLINKFDSIISSLGHPASISRDENPIKYYETGLTGGQFLTILICIGWAILGIVAMSKAQQFYFILSLIFLVIPIIVIVGIVVTIVDNNKQYKDNEMMISNKHQNEVRCDRERVQRENEAKVLYIQARDKMYQSYEKTCYLLEHLYAKNVIYEKYRYDLVAISMFAEYLNSERCYTLVGHEGAYNIYEHEIRMGLIISKLDEVIERLDRIEDNQYRLFETINGISNKMDSIVTNMKSIMKKQNKQLEDSEYMRYCMELQRRNNAIAMIYGVRYH